MSIVSGSKADVLDPRIDMQDSIRLENVTETERDAKTNPKVGDTVFNTDTQHLNTFVSPGGWTEVTGGGGSFSVQDEAVLYGGPGNTIKSSQSEMKYNDVLHSGVFGDPLGEIVGNVENSFVMGGDGCFIRNISSPSTPVANFIGGGSNQLIQNGSFNALFGTDSRIENANVSFGVGQFIEIFHSKCIVLSTSNSTVTTTSPGVVCIDGESGVCIGGVDADNNTLRVAGSFAKNHRTTTDTVVNLLNEDCVVELEANGSARTVNINTADVSPGRRLTILGPTDAAANNVTITTTSGALRGGDVVITSPNDKVELTCGATQFWSILD